LILKASDENIALSARALIDGELVVFPTETVYGLGADASQAQAVVAIYALKGRPPDHPLIVHCSNAEKALEWADPDGLTERVKRLASAFWPGPMTLIVTRTRSRESLASGGQNTIGIRVPAHPVATRLLEQFERLGGFGVAAPSANRFGRISPSSAEHVLHDLGADSPVILDGGAAQVGIESTIIDVSRGKIEILRPGAIRQIDIDRVLGNADQETDVDGLRAASVPRVSGSLDSHYAPLTTAQAVSSENLALRLRMLIEAQQSVAVVAMQKSPSWAQSNHKILWISMPADPISFAQQLYDRLRYADVSGSDVLLIELPPDHLDWDAIRDRLTRATHS
jgi:L-threonylcarbamoyladenylate synthase